MPDLLEAIPALVGRVPWVRLGTWPTPVERLDLGSGGPLYVKRDDLSAAAYGGNKVRTLETLFGQAQAVGARRLFATGAYGSNHALATVLHAGAAGFEAGVILFPQPPTACARENLVATLSRRPLVRALWTVLGVPTAIWAERRRGSYVMLPGGATPTGALGYVSAAFELLAQVQAGTLPAPTRIVLGVGSTCTTAGLLAGTAIAEKMGLWREPPEIHAVRVTPWPVTAAWRIVSLAARTTRLVAELAGEARFAVPRRELAARLQVIGGQIGRGYGHVTPAGSAAIERFRQGGGPPLDTCYSAKAAAGLLANQRDGAALFWATKSSAPLPPVDDAALAGAPARMRHWLARRLLG